MDVPLFGGDVPNLPPNELSPTSHGGFAIAIYILSAFGLILFIVVMVLYIITWSRRSKASETISGAIKEANKGGQVDIGADYKTAGATEQRSAQKQERNLEPPFLAPGSIQ